MHEKTFSYLNIYKIFNLHAFLLKAHVGMSELNQSIIEDGGVSTLNQSMY